ncbi:response regulator [Bacillus phage vB_BceS_LY5]|uniref:response regulator n=1 Tax=Bacillus phage vB_BceS_LY5 TaxID=2996058 RepID=UPI004054E11A|nr:response regulator [Bacillus phage vB_BceS_LY5]
MGSNIPRKIEYEINKNGCYICTSHAQNSSDGHIRIRRNGKRYLAHRYVYEQHYGEIPKDLVVRHKCDTPQCLNVDHMELGTPLDNVQDRVSRGRNAVGENASKAKLTEIEVLEIRSLYAEGNTGTALAKIFNVTSSTIYGIVNKKYWKHI